MPQIHSCIQSSMTIIFSVLLAAPCVRPAAAQSIGAGRWADAKDPAALKLIDIERRWAESVCDGNTTPNAYLADDFVGTSPKGPLYTKAEYLAEPEAAPGAVKGCKLLSARVRFYGDGLAMIYGSEISIPKDKSGKEYTRKLIWTDTWVNRGGKWQIVAVQDMEMTK